MHPTPQYDHMLALTAKLEDKAIKADAKLREANIDREKLKAESESAKRDFRACALTGSFLTSLYKTDR